MNSIRVRLFLMLSGLFAVLLFLSLGALTHFLELQSLRSQITKGHDLNRAFANELSRANTALEDLNRIKADSQALKPVSRKATTTKMVELLEQNKKSELRRHYKAFQINESEFQRFSLNQMDFLEKKILFLFGIMGLTLVLGFITLHLYVSGAVIKPMKDLSFRMTDFLSNRFTYKFGVPSNNELGELHGSFNSLAQRVISYTEELKSLDQAKSDFLSIASHELRTPLTSIKGSLSLLQSGIVGNVNEMSAELLQIAEVESDRLIRLINDLLDLAKIEAGKLPLNAQWQSVDGLVTTVFQSLQGLAHNAQVELTYPEENSSLQVFIDRDRIQQVLTNLLSNAIKFSPPHSSIIVSVSQTSEGTLKFEVRDHGKGIAPEDQELIFQKFRQASGPNNPIVKGTGLGLAIAKALVEEHSGHIGLTSKPGEGSVFFFTLPKWKYVFADGVRSAG